MLTDILAVIAIERTSIGLSIPPIEIIERAKYLILNATGKWPWEIKIQRTQDPVKPIFYLTLDMIKSPSKIAALNK